MATTTTKKDPASIGVEIGLLRGEVVKYGSSWAALQFALATVPMNLKEMLSAVCVYDLQGEARTRAFDACVDGYAVFSDGRRRGKL